MGNVRTAIVLAGGEGLRMRPITEGIPKPMIVVAGKPLLEWIIEWLRANHISKVVVGVAHRKEKIIEKFGSGESFGVDVNYSEHTVDGGTAEGFRLAIQRFVQDEHFLAMNGDELVDLNVQAFAQHHVQTGGVATIAVGPLRSPYGVVELNGTDVVGFQEKPTLSSHYVSVGVYVFSRKILDYLPGKGDVERAVFPRLASDGKLKAYVHDGFWATINTMKDLEDVERELTRRSK